MVSSAADVDATHVGAAAQPGAIALAVAGARA
jgi:hypothetical protein